ncbi:MAG: signal peptide peptidase SppA [Opitutaceae bacterium]|jgi:protease-4|nr:signal peptide peptidase SppA [Opitutaceae bacterium]
MRNFLASFLGTLSAFAVAAGCALAALLALLAIAVAVAARKHHAPPVEQGCYLSLDLGMSLTDRPPLSDNAFLNDFLAESDAPRVQLRTLTRAVREAARDPRVAGIRLAGSLAADAHGNGFAALKELRDALAAFRAAGKPILARLTTAETADYYLMSVADDIVMDPFGLLVLPGLVTEPLFFAGAFERFGVGVQVSKSGDYKSYAEPFVRRDLSPENRQQLQALLDDIWGGLLDEIAASRKLEPAALQRLADGHALLQPETALAAGLVTRVAHEDEVDDELASRTGEAADGSRFKAVPVDAYLATLPPDTAHADRDNLPGPKIAIVYAEGDIVDGDSTETGEVGGDAFAEEISRLRDDSDVRAVVVRVNSPGGSASAAERIERELRLTAAEKPVVVSMGSYAASGGYWISARANHIFAENSTVTGSIGVIGLQFDVKKLANDLGVTWDAVKTGKHADFLGFSRPKTEAEMAIFQHLVDRTYDEFLSKVSEGRDLPPEKVRALAGGRVWSGRKAVRNGLADEIGGLDAAVAWAAAAAGLPANGVPFVEFPRPRSFSEWLESLPSRRRIGGIRAGGGLSRVLSAAERGSRELARFNDPRGLYLRLPAGLSVR